MIGRCKQCRSYRDTLRSALSRQTLSSDRTDPGSHTPYGNLTSNEKDSRLKSLHNSLRLARRKIATLEDKMKKINEEQAIDLQVGTNHYILNALLGVYLQESDTSDVHSLITDVSSVVKEQYPPETPQRIFWDQQVHYNSLKNPKQMRWHPFMIRFALNVKYLSSAAYRALRESGVIHLPSERTLADYTHWVTPHSGVQLEYIEKFKRQLDDLPEGQRQSACLSMDEMKIKSGLVFDKHRGTLVRQC